MNEIMIGKKYKIFLTNGFKYEGKLLSEGDSFIQILEAKGHSKTIGKASITIIEEVK
jgi:sRNA-binding regulator protein Hfq